MLSHIPCKPVKPNILTSVRAGLFMGMNRFDWVSNKSMAASEATDLISAKHLNAEMHEEMEFAQAA